MKPVRFSISNPLTLKRETLNSHCMSVALKCEWVLANYLTNQAKEDSIMLGISFR